MKPIGIFGGTFAPPHNGHITAAKAFYEQCGLDRLYIIPTAIPPHKRIDFADDPKQRLEMLKLAFEDDPRYNIPGGIFISDYEISRNDVSYTVNTLEYFTSEYGKPMVFLCGADMFVTLDKWRRAEDIFRLTSIAYAGRSGIDTEAKAIEYREKFGAKLIKIDMPEVALASSDIRSRLENGEDISGEIPEKVEAYIRQHGLYGQKTYIN